MKSKSLALRVVKEKVENVNPKDSNTGRQIKRTKHALFFKSHYFLTLELSMPGPLELQTIQLS